MNKQTMDIATDIYARVAATMAHQSGYHDNDLERVADYALMAAKVFIRAVVEADQPTSVLEQSVDEIDGISIRVLNVCAQSNIKTLADMARLTEEEWLMLPNMGKRSLRQVREALQAVGFSIGDLAPHRPPQKKTDTSGHADLALDMT